MILRGILGFLLFVLVLSLAIILEGIAVAAINTLTGFAAEGVVRILFAVIGAAGGVWLGKSTLDRVMKVYPSAAIAWVFIALCLLAIVGALATMGGVYAPFRLAELARDIVALAATFFFFRPDKQGA
ncbi:MAG: hypothetical protein JO167_04625 [Alphaproteobacteria bacterium]|nr:hypothetical protein [Alphaproteobacteria bacterium]